VLNWHKIDSDSGLNTLELAIANNTFLSEYSSRFAKQNVHDDF